jgi:hypothetical protein
MNPLKAADDFLKRKLQDAKDEKNRQDMIGIFSILGSNLVDQVKEAIQGLKIAAPNVSVNVPDVIVPKIDTPTLPPFPDFPEIKLPPINVPAPQVTVNVPEIKIPNIQVPEPKVTVNIPKVDAPIVNVSPTPVTFPDVMRLKPADKPFPVLMVDQAGKPMAFSSGAGGGRGDFFTIKDIQTSSGASLIDQMEGALKVTGNFSVTSSATSTIAQIGNSDGDFSVSNPLPITGSISTTPGATFYASDAVGSVNVIQSVPIDVRQVSGISFSTDVLSMPAVTVTSITNSVAAALVDSSGLAYSGSNPIPITGSISTTPGATFYASDAVGSMNLIQVGGNPVVVGTGYQDNAIRVVHATDAVVSVNVISGVSTGLTDTQLRASHIDIVQMSGTIDSVYITGAAASTFAEIMNPDGRVKVELPTGSSGLTDTELRASHIDVMQMSGANWSVSVTDVFGTTATNLVNPDGRMKVELPTGSSGLTDTELRASHLDVQQLSGAIDSVNVLTMPAVTVTSITNSTATNIVDSTGVAYSGSNPVPITGAVTQSGTWNVATLTGIINTIAAANIDSSGVQYSGSNPFPFTLVTNATATMNVALTDSSGVQYSGSNPLPTSATLTLPSGQGDAASATRVVIAGNSDASVVVNSGTITTVTTLTGITNSVATVLTDSTGVAYSGSNPVPTSATIALPFGPGDGATATRFIQAGDTVSSTNILQVNGTTVDTNTGASSAGSLRTILASNSNLSTQTTTDAIPSSNDLPASMAMMMGLNGTSWDRAKLANLGTGEVQTTTLRTVHATDVATSVFVTGSLDSMMTHIARTTNPTAVADGADIRPMADKLGRTVITPVQVRELIATAFVALATNTETTLLAGAAGQYLDLISVSASTTSLFTRGGTTGSAQGSITLTIRESTAGGTVTILSVPSADYGPAVWTPAVPYPQANPNAAWTVQLGTDISTGSQVTNITALFAKNI